MDIESIIKEIPKFLDLEKNLKSSLETSALSKSQIWGSALAAAITCKEEKTYKTIYLEAKKNLSESEIKASKEAASIMSMNNVYWRFWYLVDDKEYLDIPANISTEIFTKHGIEEIDFECFTLAVSIINQCAGCLKVHSRKMLKLGFNKSQIMAVIKIAAAVHSLAVSNFSGRLN